MRKRERDTWPFEEKSTRNCLYCKTTLANGAAKAYCSQGKHLANIKRSGNKLYGISLLRVLSSATWASPRCRDCLLFEHDVPIGRS